MEPLDEKFWTSRYQQADTGWDTGSITTPLKEYVDQLQNKQLEILIPGAGNAHEAEYLFLNGFTNTTVVDLSEEPLKNLKKRVPAFPDKQLIQGNFFDLEKKFDLVIEQTFFCAIDPALRAAYAKKMHEVLKPGGKLVGVLWDAEMNKEHPPFGGNKTEYLGYFEPYFEIRKMEACYNSIKPRAGREMFILLVNKA